MSDPATEKLENLTIQGMVIVPVSCLMRKPDFVFFTSCNISGYTAMRGLILGFKKQRDCDITILWVVGGPVVWWWNIILQTNRS